MHAAVHGPFRLRSARYRGQPRVAGIPPEGRIAAAHQARPPSAHADRGSGARQLLGVRPTQGVSRSASEVWGEYNHQEIPPGIVDRYEKSTSTAGPQLVLFLKLEGLVTARSGMGHHAERKLRATLELVQRPFEAGGGPIGRFVLGGVGH